MMTALNVSLIPIQEVVMIVLAYILSGVSLLMSVLLLVQSENPLGWIGLAFKLPAAALSPYGAIIGAAGAVLGWVYQALWAIPIGLVGAGMMIWYVWRCTRDHTGFDEAFGAGWADRIPPAQASKMVQRRWTFFLPMKASPEPLWERDVPFWTVPGTDRELLCDIWRPAGGDVSGLAFVYFHGSGWWVGDKDVLTRPFFRHLIAQGHTVMDVSYRLCPEVDIYGMIGDIKRAVAWMKAHADRYGVDPEKIVLGGGSAGGHLSLLAGYAPQHPELTPEGIKDADLSVCGVISHYGPTDLLAAYQHENQQQTVGLPPVPIGPDSTASRSDWGRMDVLLGDHPQDAPEIYQLASPITHVHPGCPPTLLIQGKQDFITPVDATNALHAKLVECGVPAINVVFPWTDHGFDLAFPQVNPASQSSLYDVDRFLALLLNNN
jgi:acetyl esterase/lipase